jgi:imidazolonepropionase-like amidohydrolase
MPVIIRADAKRDIEAAVKFAEQEGISMILAGGREAWEVKELLAEKNVPVILGSTLSLPREEDLPYDMPFRNPGELVEAGVSIAFASGAGGGFGPSGPHGSRTVPYEAAAAVAYGLPEEEALRAVTLNAAEMLGVGDRLGSIEPGKVGNLIVTDGNPLEIRTRIEHVVIAGREVSTENRHKALYDQYRGR